MYPDVNIELGSGNLGINSPSQDGISAMIMTGTGTVGIPLGTPKLINTLQDAVDLGITESGQPSAYRHIKEFYEGYRFISGSSVAELYIMLLGNTVTLTNMSDMTTLTGAKQLLEYSNGRVRYLGLTRTPASGYTPNIDDGIDADVLTAIPKAHDLANSFAKAQAPVRVLMEGRGFKYENVGDLKDLTTMAFNRVGVVLWSTKSDGSASVGFTLGVKAALPVQRKISRVKNGQLSFPEAFIGDKPISEMSSMEPIHNKGYIALREYPNRSGYYFTGEPMACAAGDDYSILSRGAVIDKAQRLAYNRFLQEVEDDVEVDESTGELIDGYKKWLEHEIVQEISRNMPGEISGEPNFLIVPGQNIISSSTTKVVLKVTPKGYQSKFDVLLEFQNPALAN